nr:non-ribosomal peptide synthetase [Rhodococcus sp. (in: high G+C Gram-positive bacteria)]
MAVRLTGELDFEALTSAVDDVISRHETLRTVYPEVDGVGSQRILGLDGVSVDVEPHPTSLGSIEEALARTVDAPFDLEIEVPLRTRVLRLGENDHVLVLVTHHIAADGFSMAPLARDVMIAYAARTVGTEPAWAPLPVQYADYTLWQYEVLGSPDDPSSTMSIQERFWLSELASLPQQLELPTSFSRPNVMSGRGGSTTFSLDADLHGRIAALARSRRSTPFMVVHAALAVMLSKLAGTTDVAVGTPTAGRGDAALDDLVGMFVGTLVLRTTIAPEVSFSALLDDVARIDLAAFGNADVPFERIVEVVDPARSQSRHPLVQVLLAFQNVEQATFELPGLSVSAVDIDGATAKMDLQFTFVERRAADGTAEGYDGTVTYARDLFDEPAAELLGARLVRLLDTLTSAPDTVVGDVALLDDVERHRIVVEWNDTERIVERAETVASMLADRAARSPDASAVSFAGQSLTYGQFARRVAQTARWLISLGVGPDERVAVSMHRSVDLLVVLHAVVAAGGAYVPVDPGQPDERTNYVLDVSRPVLVVSEIDHGAVAGFSEASLSDTDRLTPLRPSNAAYVVFTSGSTGRPKGVAVSHGAVVNQLAWLIAEYGLGAGDVVLQKTPFTFDVSVWELFGALACGARLVVAEPGGHRDVEYLGSVIESEGVTATSFVPSMLSVFASEVAVSGADVSSLRHVLVAGEGLSTSVADAAARVLPDARMHNLYGPTEFTVHAAAFSLEGVSVHGVGVPIGRPVWNSAVFVLDSRLHPVPVGVVGELYLAGTQLARGYFGRADLTADRFVANPFASGERVYRSGDLVRWSFEGELEFVGRSDFQVKLRGQRIELGEIENVLESEVSVSRAVVVVCDDRLVAYVVGDGVDVDGLKGAVGERLPSYMVPSVVVLLDVLPVGVSGKLDRAALPVPVFEVREFRSAVSPVEVVVAGVFAEVLGVERVGLDDDFFELGGNSLVATQLVSRVGAVLGVRVPVRVVFEASSVEGVASLVEGVVSGGGGRSRVALVGRVRSGVVPLSLAQQRMWFLNRLDPGSAVDNIPLAIRLRGELDAAALKSAIDDVLTRHESLRTVYPEVDGVGHQEVLDPDGASIEWGSRSVTEPQITSAALEFFARGFDVTTELPVRAALLELSESDHVLLVVVHHIAADGFSIAPLTRDLVIAYGARVAGAAPMWNPLPVQYADYTLWQREMVGSEDDPCSIAAGQLAYWTARLAGLPDQIELPSDRARPVVASGRGAMHTFFVDADLRTAVESLAGERRSTPFMVVHTALAVLLSRLTGVEDIAVGTPVAGRGDEALDDLIGMFVGTLVLRTAVPRNLEFGELLDAVRATDLDAFEHADLPFERLVEVLDPPRSRGRHPLVQVLLSFQNLPVSTTRIPGLEISGVDFDASTAKMDLAITVADDLDAAGALRYRCDITYATDLFDGPTIEVFGRRLIRVLEGVTAKPSSVVGDIDVLETDERTTLLTRWNETEHSTASWESVLDEFDQRVTQTPDAVALVYAGQSWTYSEFDARVSVLARGLVASGIGPEKIVAVSLRRSADMVAALYAIFRAGAAYVPIDPDQPEQRTRAIVDDASPDLIVVSDTEGESRSRTVTVRDLVSVGSTASTPLVFQRPQPDSLAYVVFTSGSTGRPKGVAVSHGAVVNQLAWLIAEYGLGAGDVVLQKTPFTFDVSVWELFGALACGARLVVAEPGGHRDVEYLGSVIESEGVTATSFVPSMLSVFASEVAVSGADVSSLRHVLVAGEGLSTSVADAAARVLPDARMHNLYGPTEFTVHAAAFSLEGVSVHGVGVPIGRPVWNSAVFVLDSRLHPVPVGVVGELYLAGTQLARGYFGRADLTADRFVANPFASGERVYRSGDLVRWSFEGELEFVGRSDFQVKLRGQRIELGEIENVLESEVSVSRAVVVVCDDRLVAYVVGDGVDVDGLKGAVGERLPSYMVPSVVVLLDVLPVGVSGKLDRAALPVPVFEVREFRSAVSPVEVVVAGVFAEVLGVERVGLDDDFFELGGNSLVATQLVSRVGAVLGVRVPVRVVFEASSVEGVASLVEGVVSGGGGRSRVALVGRVRSGVVPLSLAQQRMWFLNRLDPGSAVYNVPMVVSLSGDLDTAALDHAVRDVISRHQTLRTRYPAVDGVPVQQVVSVDDVIVDMTPIPVTETEARHRIAHIVGGGFDVDSEVPVRGALFEIGPREHVLVVVIHHIAGDGSSIAPLARDVMTAYAARSRGDAPAWAPLPVQYADFTLWQREVLGAVEDPNSVAHEQVEFWRDALGGVPDVLDLPLDRPRPAVQSMAGATTGFELDRAVHEGIDRLARESGSTRFMVVHAALAALLARWSGGSDIVVGTPVAGRGERELDDVIGMFVNTLVLRTPVDPSASFRDLIDSVRTGDIAAFGHADLPFEWLVDELSPSRSTAHSPLFQTLLVFQNFAREAFELDGLTVAAVDADTGTAKYDLQFSFIEKFGESGELDGVFVSITYATAVFDTSTVEAAGNRLAAILDAAIADPSRRIGSIDLVGEADHATLRSWNETGHSVDPDATLVSLFDAQVARTPDAIALVDGTTSLTYRDFDVLVNRTARLLVGKGLGPGTTAAVAMGRSIEMVTSMYAVVKTGAAYVPLDPDQPTERVRHVLEVADPLLVLTSGSGTFTPPASTAEVIDVDALDLARYSGEPITDIDRLLPLRGDELAYLMFTSGSTGLPKGIELTHAATVNQLAWAQSTYPLDASDAVLHKTPITFDVSVWELFWTLQTGARLVIAEPGGHRDPAYLSTAIDRYGITTIHFVPSMLSAFALAQGGLGNTVRRVFAAGEALTAAVAEQFLSLNTAELHNWYGPAEAEVVTASEVVPHARAVTIGSPVWNTTARVLDEWLEPVPIGVPGELYLGGAQLARGYRGRSTLTAERFVADPSAPGRRMYRTGDLVHWTRNGELVYRGRSDFQIKLRGQRIEPGDIEVALAKHPDVHAVVVVLHHDDSVGDRLVAYVGSPSAVEPDVLIDFVSDRVPSYMVPSGIVVLAGLPLGPTGKLDRRALPAPVLRGAEFRAPETDAERRVAALFEEVLGVETTGLDDDFFALGGNSLIATQVVARAGVSFDKRIPLRALFEASTVEGFARRLNTAADADTRPALVAQVRPDRIPLSLTQQRLWVLNRLYPDTGVRNIPVAVRLTGPLDVSSLRGAARDLFERHEVLRTSYPEFEGNGYQDIREVDDIEQFGDVGLDLTPKEISERDVVSTVEEFVTRPFDVTTEVPLRAMLARVSVTEHVIVFVVHHIAADGFSMRPLTTDLMVAYAARLAGSPSSRPPLAVQYADYALWQRTVMGSEDDPASLVSRQLSYWRDHLADMPDRIDLPFDRRRPAVSSYRGATSRVSVPPELRRALDSLARSKNASLFMVVHAALAVLIGRLSASTDIAISAPTAGRGEAELDDVIGMFVNSVVLRSRIAPSQSFDAVVDHVRDTDLTAFAHADVPFERVMDEIDSGVSWASRSPLQIALSFQNLGWSSLELSGLQVDPVEFDVRAAKYDLHFTVEDSIDENGFAGLLVSITYAVDLFDAGTAATIGDRFLRILTSVAENPHAVVGDIDILADEDREALLEVDGTKVDGTEVDGERVDFHVLDAFDRRVQIAPDSVALVSGDTTMTYREFDERVTAVSRGLVASGVGPETIVALALPRSTESVISVYAVLRAGAAFLPLDPDQPARRNDRVVALARPAVTVTTDRYVDSLPNSVSYADLVSRGRDGTVTAAVLPSPTNLAYVLFTSGSTGEPKGVAISHAAVVNQIGWIARTYELGADDVVLFKTPSVFDVSIWELFGPLATGGSVVVAEPHGHQDLRYLEQTIADYGVTAVSFVPSMLSVFTAQADPSKLTSLRRVLVAGEVLSASVARRASKVLPARSIHNLYGPTEFTVHATSHPLTDGEDRDSGIPIGRPVSNSVVHVLDSRLSPVPLGVIGELYLSGVQVARGYYGRGDLTAERFVADPFGTPGGRLYRTGDLVRRRGAGELVFVRRADLQVKLRGQRVELGEIETALMQFDVIGQAVVDVSEDRLVAYVTQADAAVTVPVGPIRKELRSVLPVYMIPGTFVVLASLPTTPNGKVDRRALPAPVFEKKIYRSPEGPIEETVARVFADVLDLPEVGRDDDFFELGGNSLLATKVVSRLGDAVNASIPLRLLFDVATVQELASAVRSRVDDGRPILLARRERPDHVPLSVQQQRTWMLSQWIPTSPYFNIPIVVRLKGALDANALDAAVHDVITRHESLRTVFVGRDGVPEQRVLALDEVRVDIGPVDVSERELQERFSGVIDVGFDISVDAPLRVVLFRLAADEHVVAVVFHHIAADGSSFGPFVRDLARAYFARLAGDVPDWAPLPLQYADFALWQRERLGELDDPSSTASAQLEFWREQFAGQPDLLNVPLDRARPEIRTMEGGSISIGVEPDLHAAIDRCARAAGTTRFMVVHAAMAVMLARSSDNPDVAIGTPTAGRGNEMLDDLVGMFVSTVVLRTVVDMSSTFTDLLADVRRRDIDAFENTDIPFDWLVSELLPPRPVSQAPFFQVLMAFQNYEQNLPALGDMQMSFIDTTSDTAKVDLHFTFLESTDLDGSCSGMAIRIAYAAELFDRSTVQALGDRLRRVFAAIAGNPDVVVGDIDLSGDAVDIVGTEFALE